MHDLITREYRTIREIAGPLLFVQRVNKAALGDMVEILLENGSVRRGQVIELSEQHATIQVLEETTGLGVSATRIRLTDGGNSFNPVWTPDGRHIIFSYGRSRDGEDLYRIPADGTGVREPLLTGTTGIFPSSWSPDGGMLAFYEINPSHNIGVLADEDDAVPVYLLATRYHERTPMFSPDGRWLAYVSSESGSDEVYLQPYPGPGPKTLVSTGWSYEALWSPDGRELFYRQKGGNRMMAVTVETNPQLKFGKPRVLFEGPYFITRGGIPMSYDVSPDGRFLMIRSDPAPTHLNVVLNWFEELKRLVPTN